MKRIFDLLLLLVVAPAALPIMGATALAVRLTSPGPALYWSDRVGKGKVLFPMAKFRSMRVGAPVVATHLMTDASSHLTPIGGFLRKSSLDELPQLYNILRGDMSFVGPRPALFNQDDLIALREERGVNVLAPGVTGWAQINGRDDLPIPEKVAYDAWYGEHRSLFLDVKILFLTFRRVIAGSGVSH